MAAVIFGLPLFPKAAPQTISSPAIVVKHVDEMESLLHDPKISPPNKPAGVLEEKVSAQSFCIFLPYHFCLQKQQHISTKQRNKLRTLEVPETTASSQPVTSIDKLKSCNHLHLGVLTYGSEMARLLHRAWAKWWR